MGDPLQDRRPLRELAGSHQVIEISNKIEDFDRLVEVIEAEMARLPADDVPAGWRTSSVTGRLAFGYVDAQESAAALEMDVTADIAAVCQRCLTAFELPVRTNVKLAFSTGDDDADAHGDYEVWELADDAVSPIELVEEALIMAMPLSAMHENSDDCVALDAVDEQEQMTKPFASLRAQMDEHK